MILYDPVLPYASTTKYADCVKCGEHHSPELWRSVVWIDLHQLLAYPCVACGHSIYTKAADA